MSSTAVETLTSTLEERSVSWSRTAAACEDALAEAVVEPAVGTDLPFDGVALPASVRRDPTPSELADAATGVTAAAFAVADYGSVVLTSGAEGTEQVSLYPRRHVAVVAASDVLSDMAAAFDRLDDAFAAGETSAVIATGPSATADMGALVEGAHGPEEVHVVVLEDR